MSNSKWHYAVIGGYLKDGNDKIYGITCHHVIQHSVDGCVYIKTDKEEYVTFGKKLIKHGNIHMNLDIDLIEIKEDFHAQCAKWNREYMSVKIFEGDIESLYGKNIRSISGRISEADVVYVCESTADNEDGSEKYETESDTKELVTKQGIVQAFDSESRHVHYFDDGVNIEGYAPIFNLKDTLVPALNSEEEANHHDDGDDDDGDDDDVEEEDLSDTYDDEDDNSYKGVVKGSVCTKGEHIKVGVADQILVKCEGRPFTKGDSGTVVAFTHDNTLTLVGVLTSGLEHEELEPDFFYTQCVLLRTGIKYLEVAYGIKLDLLAETQIATVETVKIDELIHAGYIIWIKTPEDIKEIEYVLLERVHCLLNDSVDPRDLQDEVEIECALSCWVSSRWAETPETPSNSMRAAVCYYCSIIGIDFLYKGNYKKAEQKLKQACKCLLKTPYRNRLLCKIITYTTWLMLRTDHIPDMLKLLETGRPFITNMYDRKVCPVRSMGYFYFDYARYYMAVKQQHEALPMNQQSIYYFSCDRTSIHGVGEMLGLCQRARIHLGCGEYFETRDSPTTTTSINEARDCLRQVKQHRKEGLVMVVYLLTSIDYHYKQGDMVKALNMAEHCCTEAEANNLSEELERAQIRRDVLRV